MNHGGTVDKPYIVWQLEPGHYQYSWEQRWCVGRFETLEDAIQAAKQAVESGPTFRRALEDRTISTYEVVRAADDIWIQGHRGAFDYRAYIWTRLAELRRVDRS